MGCRWKSSRRRIAASAWCAFSARRKPSAQCRENEYRISWAPSVLCDDQARTSLENKMALSPDNVSMALFCDFENVALGVRDANYDKFDIKPILERLLLKGSIVVKKAY